MARPVVAVTDPIHEDGIALLRDHARVIEFEQLDPAQQEAALAEAEGLVVRMYGASAETLARCPRLKVVALHGAGVDNIDIPSATELGVAIANTPGGALATGMAEGAVTMMLAVWKRVVELHHLVATGQYGVRDHWRQADLDGRVLGLVGCGHIGREVARICRDGFRMAVIAYDPFLSAEQARAAGVEPLGSLEALLARADIVSIHTPLTEQTRNMIGAAELRRMKPTAIIVNVSRGGIIDEAALVEALSSGRIRGAGLDVFAQEPPDPASPIFHLPNLIAAPHVIGLTEEGLRHMAVASARVVLDVLGGARPATLINPDVWDRRRR